MLQQLNALKHGLAQGKAVGLGRGDAEVWRWDWSLGYSVKQKTLERNVLFLLLFFQFFHSVFASSLYRFPLGCLQFCRFDRLICFLFKKIIKTLLSQYYYILISLNKVERLNLNQSKKMFPKTQILKILQKVNTDLQHKSITIQLATPRTIATFYLGYQLYIRFIDHQVRKQLTSQQKSLNTYMELLFSSEKHGFFIANGLPYAGMVTAWWAYHQSKNLYWVLGGGIFATMLVYDYFFVGPVKDRLVKDFRQDVRFITEKKQMEKTHKRFGLLKKLTHLFDGKIVISLLALVAFYLAELKHSEHVDMKLSLKK